MTNKYAGMTKEKEIAPRNPRDFRDLVLEISFEISEGFGPERRASQ
jgi:hypothetical protein